MENTTKKSVFGTMFEYLDLPWVKRYWTLVIFLTPLILAADDFKGGLQKAMGYGIYLSIVAALLFLGEGIYRMATGGNYGRDIIGLILSAGALALVTALYAAFGVSASLTPTF